jgi:hypothetical protein
MKALIWKELRENLKWVPLPSVVILLVFFIDKPSEPMPDITETFFLALTAVVFGAALGFVQIFSEAHGDKRSLLLHRPLSRPRIFLAKVLAGIGLYLLALGIPFLCLESWYATPGKMSAPYHWRTGLPWLADILSGLVYYFAGMLVAQREVRRYASRGLPLAAAFLCSYLVWILPEFWQASLAIGIIALFVGAAALGSFAAGGAYAPQPRFAKTALTMTFCAGLLIVSMLGKQLLGEWLDSGIDLDYRPDRQGRILRIPFKAGVGEIGPWVDLNGKEPSDLNGKKIGPEILAPWWAHNEMPLPWSYRNSGRFYVKCINDTVPDQELWYFDQNRRRLFGYDTILHNCLGSFGPNGFTPTDQPPGEPFQGELRYRSGSWSARPQSLLAFPGGAYTIDFAHRSIRTLFTPAAGETVTFACPWSDELNRKRDLVVVSTDKAFHFVTPKGSLVVSVPRVYDSMNYGTVLLGLFENPERYFVWYQCWLAYATYLEPEEWKSLPGPLLEYDASGRELARRIVPPTPYPAASYAQALFGLVTPMTEAATLVGATRYLRSERRAQASIQKPLLLHFLESSRYYIPGTSWDRMTPSGLMAAYLALILLSAVASALGCLMLARRYAFSRARCRGWALVGFFLGWVGLVLMVVLQEWPARIACPKCRKLRVVTRDTCEHCGASHTLPVADGTEVFEENVVIPQPILAAR